MAIDTEQTSQENAIEFSPTIRHGIHRRVAPRKRMRIEPQDRLFNLDLPPTTGRQGLFRRLYQRSIPSLERMLGLDRVNAICASAAMEGTPFDWVAKCLESLQIRPRVSAEDLARILLDRLAAHVQIAGDPCHLFLPR